MGGDRGQRTDRATDRAGREDTGSLTVCLFCPQEETGSPVGSDKVAEEEGEDLEDEEEYDEEEEEDDDDRPRKKPRHGGFILDEAGASRPPLSFFIFIYDVTSFTLFLLFPSSSPSASPADTCCFSDVDEP